MASSSNNALGKRPVDVDDDADIDDLDDVLDDFTPNLPVKPPAPQTTTTTAAKPASDAPRPPAVASTTGPPDAEVTSFMDALAIEMEKMLSELGPHKDPSSSANGAAARGADGGDDPDATREMEIRAVWEGLFAESMADIPTGAAAGGGGQSDAPRESKDAFQKIRDEAAERLRQSNAEQAGPSEEDDLAALLDPGDDELQRVLEGMMGQLMSKDVLYEPLKELNDKFPSYLSSNASKLSASDLARYQAQHECASEIITVFEDPEFSEDDPKMTEKVVGLMGKMQEHGAPPAEIMGDLPPGLDLGPDGAPKLPDECVIV